MKLLVGNFLCSEKGCLGMKTTQRKQTQNWRNSVLKTSFEHLYPAMQ